MTVARLGRQRPVAGTMPEVRAAQGTRTDLGRLKGASGRTCRKVAEKEQHWKHPALALADTRSTDLEANAVAERIKQWFKSVGVLGKYSSSGAAGFLCGTMYVPALTLLSGLPWDPGLGF